MKKRFLPKDYARIHGQSLSLDGKSDFCHNDKQRDLYKQASELLKKAKKTKMHSSDTRPPAPRSHESDNTLGTP